MSFATLLCKLSRERIAELQRLADAADWREIRDDDRCYITAEVTDFWEPCERAFFVRIPPGGLIHRHNDEAIKGTTHHLVLSTNFHCTNGWQEDGQDKTCHMQAGHRYLVQREPVHWATNDGETDRIHLLVEFGSESSTCD